MTVALPSRPDLVRLRQLAKLLQRACRSGDVNALARLWAVFPGLSGEELPLAKAQLVIAREYGFPSWPKLKIEVETRVARRAAKMARTAARAQRSTERLRHVAALTDELTRLADQGDPVAMVNRKPYGRTIGLLVRDRIASRPETWTKVVDVLIKGLRHPNPRIRHECAHALDTYDDGRAAASLAPLIDDPVPRVRWMAMHALVCDACKAAPAPWGEAICQRIAERALSDPSVKVRRHAVFEVARCGAPLAVETLRAMIDREADQAARRNAERALKALLAAD